MRVSTVLGARAAVVAALALAGPGLSGCGYSIRPPYDRTIRTVYVPILKSYSFRKDINLELTRQLQQKIEHRTSFKVVGSPEEADAVLEGTINYVDKNLMVQSPYNLPRQLAALITAEVKFYDNRPGAPEKPLQSVIVSEMANFYPELGETTQLGFNKAMEKMVTQIVGMMEQPW